MGSMRAGNARIERDVALGLPVSLQTTTCGLTTAPSACSTFSGLAKHASERTSPIASSVPQARGVLS